MILGWLSVLRIYESKEGNLSRAYPISTRLGISHSVTPGLDFGETG